MSFARVMTDQNKNGNRDLKATVKHLTEDKLVAWGWAPGINVYGNPRERVPLLKAEFDRVVAAWANTGAASPDWFIPRHRTRRGSARHLCNFTP